MAGFRGTSTSPEGRAEKGGPGAKATRVFIVSDLRLHGEGLAEALDRDPRIEMLGSKVETGSTIAEVRRLQPDVVLIDMVGERYAWATRASRQAAPQAHIVALGISDFESDIIDCAEAGASVYLTRDASLDDLVATIERITKGEVVCPPRVAATLIKRIGALATRDASLPALTPRELEIMELIERGMSNKQVANTLVIELSTVKNHLHNIFEKLQVHSRTEAVARMRSYPRPREPSSTVEP